MYHLFSGFRIENSRKDIELLFSEKFCLDDLNNMELLVFLICNVLGWSIINLKGFQN